MSSLTIHRLKPQILCTEKMLRTFTIKLRKKENGILPFVSKLVLHGAVFFFVWTISGREGPIKKALIRELIKNLPVHKNSLRQ